jgi:hypothetical protein
MELLSARMSIPLRPATVNAISWRYANGCLPSLLSNAEERPPMSVVVARRALEAIQRC